MATFINGHGKRMATEKEISFGPPEFQADVYGALLSSTELGNCVSLNLSNKEASWPDI
jgi:hypothetical protein